MYNRHEVASALVMAGGRSQRMRASGYAAHKGLVPVLGVSMIERNLRALLSYGFIDIAVSVNANEEALLEYLEREAPAIVEPHGGTVHALVETFPLGTIGAARLIARPADALLVVNVDNLTALDLRALVADHIRTAAAMTIATHLERFTIPYGELRLQGCEVEEYREKPAVEVRVSSGTYVLSRRAIAAIAPNAATSIPQLFNALRGANERICAFHHDAPWVDVNDAVALERAESLFAAHSGGFDREYISP